MPTCLLVFLAVAKWDGYPFERKNQVLLVYHVRARGEIVLNEELVEYRLFPVDQVPPLPSAIGRAMNDWLASRFGDQALS